MIYRRWNVPSSRCVYHCWRDLAFWAVISPVTEGLCRDAWWLSTGKQQERSHTLLVGGAALPGHAWVFSVLTAEGPSMTAAAKGYERKGTWLKHRTESPPPVRETFRIFPEHWQRLVLSSVKWEPVLLCVSVWMFVAQLPRGLISSKQNISNSYCFITEFGLHEYRSWIHAGNMCFWGPTLYRALF